MAKPKNPRSKRNVTTGDVARALREMSQPPGNARQRPIWKQKKLVTRMRGENPPKGSRVKVSRGMTKLEKAMAQATKERPNREKLKMSPPAKKRAAKPSSIVISKRIPTKAEVRDIGLRAVQYRGRVIYLTPAQIKAIESRTPKGTPQNIYNFPDSFKKYLPSYRITADILGRELNLTPTARARLDADEARRAAMLEEEARLDYKRQVQESKRNPRVQHPALEPITRRVVEEQVRTGLREIAKAEKEKKKRERKPLRPKTIVPKGTGRGGMGGGIPLTGIGGGGLMKLD